MDANKYLLTVFSPAYNRAHTLGRTYESLCRQTSRNFCWIVVDDGSKDNTRELVSTWIAENKIPITYIYQENQGMHGAHNTAYKHIDTELNVCIDSDDFMPDDAVEIIEKSWQQHKSPHLAGIVGLDYTIEGKLIGDEFPVDVKELNIIEFYELGIRGDKKFIYRTDLIKQTKEYPLFEGEKYVSLGCRPLELGNKYPYILLNKKLAIIEYQETGNSRTMYQQYWNNPKGFSYMRKLDMISFKSIKQRLRACIHYVSSSIRSKNKAFLQESPLPLLTALCIIPGICLYLHIKRKVKLHAKMDIHVN